MKPALARGVEVRVYRANAVSKGGDPGHNWELIKNGEVIGTGWAAGSASDATEDAMDEATRLGCSAQRWSGARNAGAAVGTLLATLLLACGAPEGEYEEIGSYSPALSTKFSPTFTFGFEQVTGIINRRSPGPISGVLPGRTTVKFKITGLDEEEGCLSASWKDQVRRAMSEVETHTLAQGYGWPFSVSETTGNDASVIFQRGSCPGDQHVDTMGAFVCPLSYGPLVTVSESLNGTYKRHDGVMIVNVDFTDIWERTMPGAYPVGGGSGCSFDPELHELTEHAGHIAALFPFGQGIYPSSKSYDNGFPAWSTPDVEPSYPGSPNNTYAAGGYPDGQLCRIGNWLGGPITGSFDAQSGSCAD